jgi:hypothetical protein
MSRNYPDPHLQLASAILLRAVRDVIQGNAYAASARRFILSDVADLIMTALQLDRQAVLDQLGLSAESERVWLRAGPGGHLYLTPQEVSR